MANKVTIDVEARFIDKVSDGSASATKSVKDLGTEAEKTTKKVDNLDKKKAKPTLDADDSKLAKKLRDADSKASKLGRTKASVVLEAVDKASKVMGSVESTARRFASKTWTTLVKVKDMATSPLRKIKDMLFSIKSLVVAITAGLAAKQLILNPINLADAYSSAQIGFSTLLGKAGGQEMMDQIDAFAKATPFKTSGVISNVQKMMAYGWDASRVIEDMKTIGDAAASTGKGDEGLSSIVYALSEIRSKGKLSTQELNQLASAGIKAKQYLAAGLGFGTDDEGLMQLSEALEDGAIGANQAVELILQGMKEFDGMMDKTANETVEGLWSQIQDTFEINIFRRWGQGLQDGAKKGFGSIVSLLDNADGALESFGDTVYEVGKTISNYLADVLQDVVNNIKEITGSEAFKNAGLGEKIKMLWSGAIGNPFSKWWSRTVVPWWDGVAIPWMAKKAGEMGESLGIGLTKALRFILGDDTFDLAKEGASIGGSFAKGFAEGFDGSAVADAFADAFSKIWDAMPWWAKTLLFGYGAVKVGAGLSSIINLIKMLGSASAGTGLLGWGANAAKAMGAGGYIGKHVIGTGVGTGTSLLGLGSTAGFVAGGLTAISGVTDLYQGFKNDDKYKKEAGAWKTGGALGGAALGAAIGSFIPVVGTIAGAGIGALAGSVVGWIGSSNAEKKAEEAAKKAEEDARKAAKKEAELAASIQKGLVDHFGDIELSMAEINSALSDMFGRDVIARANAADAAISQMNSSLEAFNSADYELKKGLWLTTIQKGAKLTSDQVSNLESSADEFSSSAKKYVEDAQYASSEAITALMGDSEAAQKVLDKSTAYYEERGKKLDSLSEQLNDALSKALSDGVISIDEEKSLQNLRSQIAKVMAQIQQDQYTANVNIIKAKYSDPDISYDSFKTMMGESSAAAQEMADGFWEQFGQGSVGLEEGSEEWNALLKSTLGNITGVFADAGGLGLDKLQGKWAEELGILGKDWPRIIQENTIPEITAAAHEIAGNEQLRREIGKMLKVMQPTTDQIQGLVDSYKEAGMQVPDALKSYLSTAEFYEALAAGPEAIKEFFQNESYNTDIGPIPFDIDAKYNFPKIRQSDAQDAFDAYDALDVEIDINGNADVAWTYEPFDDEWISPSGQYSFTTEALVEAGWTYNSFEKKWISPDEKYSFSTDVDVNAKYSVNKFNGFRTDFGISSTYAFKQKVLIDQYGGKARGGFVGGTSAMEAFALGGRPADGMLRGSTRFISVNEEAPEMIIPLSSQRRERALKLWAKTGEMLDVPGFARGGSTGSRSEGFRPYSFSTNEPIGGQSVQVDVGGITVEIHVDAGGSEDVAATIKAQKDEIADAVIGMLADALEGQFENIPVRGGVA